MQSIRLLLCALLAFVTLPLAAFAAEPPTMGWSSWNTYRVNISDSLICRQADAMKRLGLGRVGYKYINIGDGFFGGRAADGTLLIGCDLTTIPPASLPDREAEEGPQHPAPRPRHSAPARHRLPAGGAIVRTFVRDII